MAWFGVGVGVVALGHLVLGWLTLHQLLYTLAGLALLRYVVLPADCDATLLFYAYFGKPVESLRGRVVWVTGASSGIGKALALRLARAGVRLALSARNTQALQEVKRLCVGSGGVGEGDVLVLGLDMVRCDHHQAALDQLLQHFGQLDILVNNAGRSQRGRWECIDLSVDRELFDLNVFSLIHLSRLAVRYFLERGEGHIAATSSTAGKLGAPMSASYTASKHALQGYFDCLRVEKAGCGLSVTMFCPGPVDSNLLNVCFTERQGEALGEERRGKRMSAERCAELFAIALANRVNEAWVADQPVLAFYYANQYLPSVMKMVLDLLPLKTVMKLRDGRADAANTQGAEATRRD